MSGTPVTGTATVVLGDVAGSTRLWQEHPDAMSAASHRLAALAEELVASHGGHRPREQGEGDNLVAVFPAATDAAAFAVALDAALAAEPWPGQLQVAMRIGLHTGDVEWDERTGYLGPTFNRCARLRDLGHARMMLLSSTTWDVIADALPAGARVEDLGVHQLRDLSRDERVFQLRAADDDRTYAPLKSVSSLPNNLPVPVDTLVGREQDILHVATLLRDHRLVSLTGAGGSGKTRLAQHVAAAVLSYAPDGAWWVDLMPVADDARVPEAIADAASLTEVFSTALLCEAVGDRQMLLVVDNCEHVIDAVADTVEALMTRCPQVRVLATSRETLDVDGEHAVRVRPLDTPDEGAPLDAAGLLDHAATRLFVERSVAAGAPAPTDADADAIATICRRLDGIPLAIELAAARSRLLGVADIAQGLDDRFTLLGSTGRRRRASRQRTLEASVAWSFDLLDEDERATMCRLAVFPGPFDLDGARAVGSLGGDGPAVLDVLASLVDKSLVAVRPATNGRRYRLLETIRQYGLDRLAERGEAEAARDAHLAWCVRATAALVKDVAVRITDPLRVDDINDWVDDIRAAEQWALRTGRVDDVVTMRAPFPLSALLLGRVGEWLRSILPLLDDDRLSPLHRAMAQGIASVCLSYAGDTATGRELGLRAVTGLEALRPVPHDLVTITRLYTCAHHGLVDNDPASVALARRTHDDLRSLDRRAIAATSSIISVLLTADHWHEADERALEAVATGRTLGITPQELAAMSLLTVTRNVAGHLEEAAATGDEAHRRIRDTWPALLPLHASANGIWAQVSIGRVDRVRELVADAAAVAGPAGSQTRTMVELGTAALAFVEHDWDAMARATDAALPRLRAMTQHFYTTVALAGRAIAHVTHDELDAATTLMDEATAMLPPDGWSYARGWTGLAAAQLAAARGCPEEALAGLATWFRPSVGTRHRGGWMPGYLVVGHWLLEAIGHPDATLVGRSTAAHLRMLGVTDETAVVVPLPVIPAVPLPSPDAAADGRTPLLDSDDAARLLVRIADELTGAAASTGVHVDRPVTGWDALTPAEVDVARRVAEGLTNKQVGEALFVSENTVKTHLKSVYAKLSVASRAELATVVAGVDP